MSESSSKRGVMNWLVSALLILTLGGCSWFSWLPWVDDDSAEDTSKPAKLLPFDAEVDL